MAVATNAIDAEPRWITGAELASRRVEKAESLIEGPLPTEGPVLLTADAKKGAESPERLLKKSQIAALPAALRMLPRWVCWRYERRKGKSTKVPVRPDGRAARSNDPATWVSFAEACAAALDRDGWGIGFMLGDGVVGIDLDQCCDPQTGVIEAWAQQVIDELKSYTEFSPSGTGLHILCRGTLPPGRHRKDRLEMYSEKRFFTVTGRRLNDCGLEDRTTELAALHRRIFGGGTGRNGHRAADGGGLDLDDQELVRRALEANDGGKFARLWAGQWQGLYPSQSEADLALCRLLALRTRGDAERIDRLFRQSGLMREKWWRDDYRQRTINAALEPVTESYGGRRAH
jgi:putative DNA primase/helicase